jgi:hypothetical protein
MIDALLPGFGTSVFRPRAAPAERLLIPIGNRSFSRTRPFRPISLNVPLLCCPATVHSQARAGD